MSTAPKMETVDYSGVNNRERVILKVRAERIRQGEIHPGKTLDIPDMSPFEKITVLLEEVGEVAHELTYDANGTRENLLKELVQVAALAVAWAEELVND